ncbi:leucine-rich repeat domain-containing protein [Chryseobacterium sp. MMS23-Vi53]|uniref:leucine-rich repeat domain-containing protein n=1 Tax=Chryseobacterium sp. MMS23-Vi53 TaxID=3386644 RepID=UPI0039E9700A
MKTKEELKQYFEKGDRPTQSQFWEWIDSYWHKEETVERIIPMMSDDMLIGHAISVTISKDVKKIKQGAFQFTGLSYQINEVNFNEGLEEIGGAFFGQNIRRVQTPSTLKVIGNNAFAYQADTVNGTGTSLEEIILNEGLTTIEDYAFNCPSSKVKDLFIPNSVQTVGHNAFALPSLETVSIPSGLDVSNAGIPSTAVIIVRPSEPLPS